MRLPPPLPVAAENSAAPPSPRRTPRSLLLLGPLLLTTILLSIGRPPARAASPAPDQEEAPGAAVSLSEGCALCHANSEASVAMRDGAQRPIAPHDLWRSSMMANSARDPLWRAVVSAEIAATPQQREHIERECMRCHAPMATQIGLDDHGTGSLLHALDCDSTLGDLARDGVSCTICHGMDPEGLGSDDQFSGRFSLNEHRRLYGPHADPFALPMFRHTTFHATQGEHILSSRLCSSCHTLSTETLDDAGARTGHRFQEQAPFLEWRNSDFRAEPGDEGPRATNCQGCHAPTSDVDGRRIETRLAHNPRGGEFRPLTERAPYGRHVFVGGNTLVPALLRDHAEELGVSASREAFDATIAAARDQLRHRTAGVSIEAVTRRESTLGFAVRVRNFAGHKLPTGHPTRRAWLEVQVLDAAGEPLFRSGAFDEAGRILGADGRALPSEAAGGPIEPHRDRIRHADEVALYRGVLADSDGEPTYVLMRAASWLVDDRLLPRGWRADGPSAELTAPVGTEGDADFEGGGDRVHFELAGVADEARRIEVRLRYQTLGARWAAELLRWDTDEVRRFQRMYESADRTPELLAEAVQELAR